MPVGGAFAALLARLEPLDPEELPPGCRIAQFEVEVRQIARQLPSREQARFIPPLGSEPGRPEAEKRALPRGLSILIADLSWGLPLASSTNLNSTVRPGLLWPPDMSVPVPAPLIVSKPAAGVGIAGSFEQRIEVTLLSLKVLLPKRAPSRLSALPDARQSRKKL